MKLKVYLESRSGCYSKTAQNNLKQVKNTCKYLNKMHFLIEYKRTQGKDISCTILMIQKNIAIERDQEIR